MIEDIQAQLHNTVDIFNFKEGQIALSALQALSKGNANSPFSSLMGMNIETAKDGQARVSLEVGMHQLNAVGILHGGVAYSLADNAAGAAAFSVLKPGTWAVTQDLHYRYHGPVRSGVLTAESTVVHHGRRTIVIHVKLTYNETLVGTADGSFAIITPDEIAPQS